MSVSTEWWQGFFQGIALDLWRGAVPEEQTKAEIDFIEKQIALTPKAKILDVPCGMGRHSLELARRGYRVTGSDQRSPRTQSPGFEEITGFSSTHGEPFALGARELWILAKK